MQSLFLPSWMCCERPTNPSQPVNKISEALRPSMVEEKGAEDLPLSQQLEQIFEMCDADDDKRLKVREMNWMHLLLTGELVSNDDFENICAEHEVSADEGLLKHHVVAYFKKSSDFLNNSEERCAYARDMTLKTYEMFECCNSRGTKHLSYRETNWMRSASGLKMLEPHGYRRASELVGARPAQGWTKYNLIQVWQLECEAYANRSITQQGRPETKEAAQERCHKLLEMYIEECSAAVVLRAEHIHNVFCITDQNKDGYIDLAELNWFHKAMAPQAEKYDQTYWKKLCVTVKADSRKGLDEPAFVQFLQINDPKNKFTPKAAKVMVSVLQNTNAKQP